MEPAQPDELLIVGPAGHSTGGVARYIAQQQRYLPENVTGSVYDIATPNGEGPVWFLGAALRSLVLAFRFPFRSPPDVVHVHTSHYFSFYLSAFYTLFTAYVWDRPVVLHTHGSSFDEFVTTDSLPVRQLQSWVFDASDAVVVLSEYWYDVVGRRAPEEKLVVLPNAVSADEYTPAVDVDPPHLVFVSNHIQRKGIEEFVAAVRELSERTPLEFEVTICGSGPLSDLSSELAAEYDHVRYLGYVDEPTKREVLCDGSIYVLPTYAEGLPIAILEAMAAANAIVSTDAGGIPDLVGPENGLTVTAGDVGDLTDSLADLIQSPERVREMGQTNHELVTSHYSWAATTRRLDTLYEDLLGAERRV
jgi:glycosyltransferase involved in cell wall biosynthesis